MGNWTVNHRDRKGKEGQSPDVPLVTGDVVWSGQGMVPWTLGHAGWKDRERSMPSTISSATSVQTSKSTHHEKPNCAQPGRWRRGKAEPHTHTVHSRGCLSSPLSGGSISHPQPCSHCQVDVNLISLGYNDRNQTSARHLSQ